jgi:hypothetical protein
MKNFLQIFSNYSNIFQFTLPFLRKCMQIICRLLESRLKGGFPPRSSKGGIYPPPAPPVWNPTCEILFLKMPSVEQGQKHMPHKYTDIKCTFDLIVLILKSGFSEFISRSLELIWQWCVPGQMLLVEFNHNLRAPKIGLARGHEVGFVAVTPETRKARVTRPVPPLSLVFEQFVSILG